MPIGGTCGPRSTENTGGVLAMKMDAARLSTDYDSLQGHKGTQIFFPLNSSRLYQNVPLFFDRDERLKGRMLTSMEVIDGTMTPVFGGVDMPSSFKNGWINLKDDCGNLLAEFPISSINRVLNGGKNRFFRKMPVDWGRSYILLNSTAGLAGSGFLFNVWTTKI